MGHAQEITWLTTHRSKRSRGSTTTIGYGVIRLVRLLRAARAKFAATDDRIAALEARVTVLEGKP